MLSKEFFIEVLREKLVTCGPPAAEGEIEALVKSAGLTLPPAYLDFLRCSNGAEGYRTGFPAYFNVWSASEVVEANREYAVSDSLPGFFAFGGNGQGELLAFDTSAASCPIYSVPGVGMNMDDAFEVAPDFETFLSAIEVPAENA